MIHYYKLHQRADICNYVKLWDDRDPPAMEVVNFLNATPQVYLVEFNFSDSGSLIEYQSLKEEAKPIDQSEYEQAYQLATQERFDVYIDGVKF